ncbi:hypothetical protein [Hymenobacter arizonensis]|uniref:Uncharacterized protein n=1 Tax=Hymenobacter arizonensis TaxID=1227077 RepID=A0A1I6ARS3_HYMAR|nr:hypothetical protein [Hymenobacter arizonensis]SFQ71423.1 hypothetical protein SAMN04515668_3826 [Hymenobacter arizonensis]
MKYFSLKMLTAVLALGATLVGCKKEELDDLYELREEPGFAGLGLPRVPLAARYAPGETVPLFVTFSETDKLRDVTVFQVINRADSVQTGVYPATGSTFNADGKLQALSVPYVVPNATNGVPVRVDVTLNFQDGSKRMRRFTYNVARAITLKFGATPATYRNGLAATAQSEGDIIGYSLILNETGIGVVPTPPMLPTAAAPLFKAVDSLTTFYRLGTGNPVRAGVIRNPSNGAANTRTVDVTIPRNANGQNITYSFVAYGAVQAVTVTAPSIAVGPATALATLRTGRISGGASATPDSLAFNFRTGLIEPAANPPAAKDLVVNSASGTVTLSAANNTRYYKATPAQVANGFFTTPTVNTAATTLYLNNSALTAELGPVAAGDVYAVRVRGAEVMLLRILSVRPSTAGSSARVRFEYRSL